MRSRAVVGDDVSGESEKETLESIESTPVFQASGSTLAVPNGMSSLRECLHAQKTANQSQKKPSCYTQMKQRTLCFSRREAL